MPSKPSPSGTDFVVKGAGLDALTTRFGDRASVEPIGGQSDLVLVRLPKTRGSAREAWQRIHDALADGASIQPVFLDADGRPQYPTGEVSVRFHRAISGDDLDRFAARHKLRVVRRNEFVPDQIVFEPVEPARYLPDVVDELGASDEARLAWANTITKYERK